LFPRRPGVCLGAIAACGWRTSRKGGTVTGNISKKLDAVPAERWVLVKFGSDVDHVNIAGAADIPLGVITDIAEAIEDPVNVHLLGSAPGTQFMVASAAIALGDFLQPAANGQVATLTATTGTHYNVGRALNAAARRRPRGGRHHAAKNRFARNN
jgi:hypothetical protein